MPENLSAEEKEAWEKSRTAGSLPTWWKPNPAEPAAAGTAPAPAAPAPPPPAAAAPGAPAPSAAPAVPAPAAEPLVKNAPPDWDHSRTAGSLPTWWKPGDPPLVAEAPPAAPPTAAAPAPPAPATPPPAAATPPPAAAAAAPPPAAWIPPPAAATLHLERSAMEAAPAPPAPPAPPDADRFQRTMVMGTFPATPRMASVMVRSGPDTGAKFVLETSPLYVGRAPDNGIVVNDPATSRRHARFEQRGQDFLVVDLGSANGTLVDGVRVVEQILASGAVITMGQNEFVVAIS